MRYQLDQYERLCFASLSCLEDAGIGVLKARTFSEVRSSSPTLCSSRNRVFSDCTYFGNGAVPVTSNVASDLLSVSFGWAPPIARV